MVLVGAWLTNGSLLDNSGNGNNGTLTIGASRGFIKSKRGLAMKFDGVNGGTSINTGDPFSNTNHTVTAWIKSRDISRQSQILWDNRESTNDGYLMNLASGNINYRLQGSDLAGATTLQNGVWYFVGISYDGTTQKVWLNGVVDNSSAQTKMVDTTNNAIIGARSFTSQTNTMFGEMQDVRVYNTGLTDAQMAKLYNDTKDFAGLIQTKRNFYYPAPTDLSNEVDKYVGSDLDTDSNAVAVDTEADATTGFTGVGLVGTGANVFESQSSIVNNSSYAFHTDANDTPTNACRAYKDIGTDFSLLEGRRYTIKFDIRHIGTGGDWEASLGGSTTAGVTILKTVTSSDTTFSHIIYDITYAVADHRYFAIREKSGTDNGGVYFDNFQVFEKTGLVGAWNMEAQNGEVIDISGEGNNGTITGANDTKGMFGRALAFDGIDNKVVLGNIGNTKSIVMRIKLGSTTEQILEGAANDKLIHVSTGTLTYPEFDNAYINGVDTDTVQADVWLSIVITSSTNVDMSAVTLALNNAAYGDLEIDDVRFYSTELTLQQAKDYNNEGAKQILFIEDFSDEGADGATKIPRGWQ